MYMEVVARIMLKSHKYGGVVIMCFGRERSRSQMCVCGGVGGGGRGHNVYDNIM